jgi:HD-GYP domain-containing protein (c-di-GMP phosphodiesterase class II)
VSDPGSTSNTPSSADDAAMTIYTARQVRRIRDVLARFSGARRSQRFYPVGHPAVREAAAGLMQSLSVYFGEGVDVALTFFENEVLLGQQLLTEESVLFDQLVRGVSEGAVNSVVFARGLSVAELERVLPILTADALEIEAMGGLDKVVQAANAPNVAMAVAKVFERDPSIEVVEDGEAARSTYSNALDLMRELDRLVKSNRAASAERVRGVVRGLVDNILTNRHALVGLSGLKDYDEYTFFHSVNVAILSLALGSTLSSDRRFLNSLGVGALMHDIGKMAIDLEILNKPGALSSEEWDQVRRHPLIGAGVAASMPGLDRASIVVILEHHMRSDLDGYPQRRPPRKQHLSSRIVALADAYDAMTSRRSYSDARLQDEAMEVLAKNSGSAFDPVLVRLFVQMLGVYPPRSVVRLSTGETGIVVKPGQADLLRPHVRVFADASGAIVEPYDVDLTSGGGTGPTIDACIDPTGLNVEVDDYL